MKEIERIIRVDHAGERGAINIYKYQLVVARCFYKDLIDPLEEMLSHELEHHKVFTELLQSRGIRFCYAIQLWSFGGMVLGLATALLGRNAIWVCTNAIETTVLHHLEWQLEYLSRHDQEAYQAVYSIKADEEAHQALGAENGEYSILYKPIFWLVSGATKFAIWLSTKL